MSGSMLKMCSVCGADRSDESFRCGRCGATHITDVFRTATNSRSYSAPRAPLQAEPPAEISNLKSQIENSGVA